LSRGEKRGAVIITEGGSKIGLGHLMRSIAVAERMRDFRRNPLFIVNDNNVVANILRRYRFRFAQVRDIAKGSSRYMHKIRRVPVLIDSKRDVTHTAERLKVNGCRVTLIDNVTHARLVVDAVIYPLEHVEPKSLDWENAKGSVHYGVNYFPLRKEFIHVSSKKDGSYVLVSMGGADFNNLTKLVVESLDNVLEDEKICVVIGESFAHRAWLSRYMRRADRNLSIVEKPAHFARVLSGAKALITALGVTVYEAAYFGIPTLVINNYESDLSDGVRLEKRGICKLLGYYREVTPDDIGRNVSMMLRQKAHRKRALRGFDGNGAVRIASIVLGDGGHT
jgi:spore coat polysaccharide biosynthesis predicted glycosyltransferase SpsG